jgi:hypothetical protein
MLEGLERIEWSELHDAYGPSLGTPGRIRALVSSSQSERERALRDLFATINHQGTIYNASVAAVPFILEIVAGKGTPDRTQALRILQGISIGTSFHDTHGSLYFHREESKTPEWQANVREEKAWVSEIHNLLSEAVPCIVNVLRGPSSREKLAAISLLATLLDNATAVEALESAALESDPAVSAAALSALGQGEHGMELIERCFEGAKNELLRTVATFQLLQHRKQTAPSEAVSYLLDHLRNPKPDLRKAYEELPDVGAFLGDLGIALASGPREAAVEAFPLLFEEVKASRYSLSYSETFGLLALAVALAPSPNGEWSDVTLSREQRLAVRLVADRAWRIERGIPTTSLNIVELLERVGLPGDRDKIFALLAGTAEGEQTPRERSKWCARPKRRSWWPFRR